MKTQFFNRRTITGWSLVAVLLLTPFLTVSGTVEFFLKLNGVAGDSTDKEYKDQIPILSWNWGGSNSGNTHLGGGTGSGKSSVDNLTVTKIYDKASPVLLMHTMTGKMIPDGSLAVRKNGLKPAEMLKIELKDILVTRVKNGGTGGNLNMTEEVTFNFGRYKITYTPVNSDGTIGTPVTFQWNIVENNTTF